MNRIELEQLRGFAIEHLPAAQKLREDMKACPAEDRESQGYEIRLYNIADDIIDRKESTAVELAAASLLMSLVCWETYDPEMLPAMNKMNRQRDGDLGNMPDALLSGIAEAAETLAKLTNQKIPLDLKPADAPTAKSEAISTETPDEDAPDEVIAALFDPVPVIVLEKMFPADNKWNNWAERASRNKLISARDGRARFNPYKAGLWFVQNRKGTQAWDIAKLYRVLVNNLPARSRDSEHLLTSYLD